jgi:hypothetical protein
MKPVAWMAAGSVASWAAAALVAGPMFALEILFGMAGPLAAAGGTWLLMERTYRRDPERLSGLMFKAFAAKMVLFAAYVVFAIEGLGLRPVPFVASFTAYFISLHLTEALWLRRLFAAQGQVSR